MSTGQTKTLLPEDVDAVVAESEAITGPLSVGEGNDIIYCRMPRLLAIIRGQGAANAALRQSLAELRDEIARESSDAGEAIRTANALRDRIAKLERAAAELYESSNAVVNGGVIARQVMRPAWDAAMRDVRAVLENEEPRL